MAGKETPVSGKSECLNYADERAMELLHKSYFVDIDCHAL